MGASTFIPSSIYSILAKGFDKLPEAVQEDRRKLAKAIYRMYERNESSDSDFNDDDLDCYEQLITLGLAKRCKTCDRGYTAWAKADHAEGVCEI